jgi:hypothetical protein
MSTVSSNLFPFSVDLNLVGINQENMGGGGLILETLFFPENSLLIQQCEVWRCHARGTSFDFPETEVLLDEFFEPNETILPLPSSEESFDDQLK